MINYLLDNGYIVKQNHHDKKEYNGFEKWRFLGEKKTPFLIAYDYTDSNMDISVLYEMSKDENDEFCSLFLCKLGIILSVFPRI